jgi:hypothetical protein
MKNQAKRNNAVIQIGPLSRYYKSVASQRIQRTNSNPKRIDTGNNERP